MLKRVNVLPGKITGARSTRETDIFTDDREAFRKK